eukprot:4284420-Prymnesium_polylepis.1
MALGHRRAAQLLVSLAAFGELWHVCRRFVPSAWALVHANDGTSDEWRPSYPKAATGDPILKTEHTSAPCYFHDPSSRFAALEGTWVNSKRQRTPTYWNLTCPFEWSKYSCVHQ